MVKEIINACLKSQIAIKLFYRVVALNIKLKKFMAYKKRGEINTSSHLILVKKRILYMHLTLLLHVYFYFMCMKCDMYFFNM